MPDDELCWLDSDSCSGEVTPMAGECHAGHDIDRTMCDYHRRGSGDASTCVDCARYGDPDTNAGPHVCWVKLAPVEVEVHEEPPLFDWDHDRPVRKGSREYLIAVSGDYDGLTFWALAPVDRYVRSNADKTADETDFVWLYDQGQLRWALVDVYDRTVIALDPEPIDQNVKAAFALVPAKI